jgi:hypothetical protein
VRYLFLILIIVTSILEARTDVFEATVSAVESEKKDINDDQYLHQISFVYFPKEGFCELKDIEISNACNNPNFSSEGLSIDSTFITTDNSTSLQCSIREILKNKYEIKISYAIGLGSREFNFVLTENNRVLDFSGLINSFDPIKNKNNTNYLTLIPRDHLVKSNCKNIKLRNDSIN